MKSPESLEAHAVDVAATRFEAAGVVTGRTRVEEPDAGAEGTLAVGIRMQGFARGALDEGEAPHPLGARRRWPLRPDPARATVAELVAVERVADVEVLGADRRGRRPERRVDRVRRLPRGPVGVGIPDRAAAEVEPAPATLGVADPAPGWQRRGVAHGGEAVVRTHVAGSGHRRSYPGRRTPPPPRRCRKRGVEIGLGAFAAKGWVLL